MKKLLLILFTLTPFWLCAQQTFVIEGKTNTVVNGQAILNTMALKHFNVFKIKQDTVPIRNHAFMFSGTIKYPGECSVQMIGKRGQNSLSEPFFIDSGYHKLTIDKASDPHDFMEIGYGVTLQNAPTNDEYIKKFLPLRNKLNKPYDDNGLAMEKCNSIKNDKARKGCLLSVRAERANIKKSFDDVLVNYLKVNPKSPIVPWLLYDAIFYNSYSDSYQTLMNECSKYAPNEIIIPLRSFLAKKKLKNPGNPFPLSDFIKANVPKNVSQNKYILVDFWFSHCGPCVAQFGRLKETYKKYHTKGFEIIAVSTDGKEAIPKYKNLIAKNDYIWPQVLDLNGVKTHTIDISGFPTGFLLDSNWKIIKTDVNPDILNSFLEEHLP